MPSTTSGRGDEIQAKASRTAQGQQPAPRHRELRADADIQHQQSQQRQHGQRQGGRPRRGHGHTILPVLLIEICLIFFDQRHTLGHAVTAAQRVCGVFECKVQKLANGRGSNV